MSIALLFAVRADQPDGNLSAPIDGPDVRRGALEIEAKPPAHVRARPRRTVLQSEAGFGKIMQGIRFAVAWSPASGRDQRAALTVTPDERGYTSHFIHHFS